MKFMRLLFISFVCVNTHSLPAMDVLQESTRHTIREQLKTGAHFAWQHRNKIGYGACLIAEMYCLDRNRSEQLYASSLMNEFKAFFMSPWFKKIALMHMLQRYFITKESQSNPENVRLFTASNHLCSSLGYANHFLRTLVFTPTHPSYFSSLRYKLHLTISSLGLIRRLIQTRRALNAPV